MSCAPACAARARSSASTRCITKPAQSVALALTPFILEATRFVTREANGGQIFLNQPASALFGIKALMGLIPGVALVLGALILFWYPLRGQRLAKMQRTCWRCTRRSTRLAAMTESALDSTAMTAAATAGRGNAASTTCSGLTAPRNRLKVDATA